MLTTQVVLWLHVVLASLWVGGMLFLSLVVAPYIRNKPYKREFFREVGKRYSLYGTGIALALLLATGLYLAYALHGGVERRTIIEKIGLFSVIVVISLIHDLWLGFKGLESRKFMILARSLGLLNLLLSLLMVYLGVRIRLGL